jgi:uncharacterized phosphosugar-binding protein
MNEASKVSGITSFYNAVKEIQEGVIQTQYETMEKVASEMAKVILKKKRIFLFGTGHSHMMMEEAFFRAGGIPAAVPVFISTLMLHENASLSSQLERTAGLAKPILNQYMPEKGELLLIFSNSGVNMLPVEMALDAQSRGMTVVAVCSLSYAKVAPLSAIGKRLADVADYCIDNGGIPGDAIVKIKDSPWRTGSSSTISGALIWNCLVTEALFQAGQKTENVPVFASFNMKNAGEHNQELLSEWSKINQHLPDH